MDEVGAAAVTAAANTRPRPRDTATRERFPRLAQWVFKPRGPEAGEVILEQRRVFIFPTRYGFFFAFSLLAFLAASINYDLALGFVLTFFLAAAALVAMLHTFRNQVHLALTPLKADAVHAGGQARFEVLLGNARADERAALWLKVPGAETVVDLAARAELTVSLPVAAPRRGLLAAPRITLETRYPLGLFRAWSYWQPALECLVYPAPSALSLDFPADPEGNGEGTPRGAGTEDFGGLREYQITDSPRHIAWKASSLALATGAPLQAKHFLGASAAEAVFDIRDFPPRVALEDRLSRLTRRVLDADARGITFTLRLPATAIGPGHGVDHRLACLKALALVEPLPLA